MLSDTELYRLNGELEQSVVLATKDPVAAQTRLEEFHATYGNLVNIDPRLRAEYLSARLLVANEIHEYAAAVEYSKAILLMSGNQDISEPKLYLAAIDLLRNSCLIGGTAADVLTFLESSRTWARVKSVSYWAFLMENILKQDSSLASASSLRIAAQRLCEFYGFAEMELTADNFHDLRMAIEAKQRAQREE